jgi:hydrogenase maturation protein HypF
LLLPVNRKINTYSILVKGRVQGIGFRPFIYRKAKELNLVGFVKNTKHGVLIACQGKKSTKLVRLLKHTPPPLSQITCINIKQHSAIRFKDFSIKKSTAMSELSDVVQIMPDLAVCNECVNDFENPVDRRYYYPFTNCTQCGPRYSIIYGPPYDRPRTTMKTFKMCKNCAEEYSDPLNRRFHAQPNACPVCGPWITLTNIRNKQNKNARIDNKIVIDNAQELLSKGKVLAIRSIGGFLLACDANNDKAVKRLRVRKNRPSKPFAIMCKDLKTIKKLCYINREETQILRSQVSPIVLLRKKLSKISVSDQIAPKNGYLGVMLPYTPLHKLLFNVSRETFTDKSSIDILIMTSANPKNEPIIANSNEIRKKLRGVVDFVLNHNRPIESRCDDSIVFDYKGPVIVRYSRGYVPEPIYLQNINLRPVLAFGSDLKNNFALGQGNKIYISPYIGDLVSQASINFMMKILEKYQKWFGIKPEIVACDLHPDYISRRLAEEYALKHNLSILTVQHHFAHLAGVMAEHGLAGPVIGIGYDGTGYGTDGNIWGSEIMILNCSGFERVDHLKYVPLIGGDAIITNPRLLAKTYLKELKQYNGLLTSSMGRLFDAVSSVLGLCHHQTFEGEAPIAVEVEAMKAYSLNFNSQLSIVNQTKNNLCDPITILKEVVALKKQKISIPEIALYFHKRIINLTCSAVKEVMRQRKIKSVCLSGGVFQNRIILDGVYSNLAKHGFSVFINRKVPINDGGVSFGQAVVAGIAKK